MKKTTLAMVITLISASACLPIASYADGPGVNNGHDWQPRNGGGQDHGDHRGPGDHDNRGGHDDRGRGDRGGPRGGERDHFAWNGHDFRRGHPMPRYYREHYRVDDWRGRGLYEPPRGEQWAYIDGNYVLMAVATGVITSIIVGSMLHN